MFMHAKGLRTTERVSCLESIKDVDSIIGSDYELQLEQI